MLEKRGGRLDALADASPIEDRSTWFAAAKERIASWAGDGVRVTPEEAASIPDDHW